MSDISKILLDGVLYDVKDSSSRPQLVEWGNSTDMNDFKTAGNYEIYGERLKLDDRLPINNSNPGHSIAAKLTVVDSSLRTTDGSPITEKSLTQFLMLSNRKGGDGNLYYRSYNENNSPNEDGWTDWVKVQGIKEGYIFGETKRINIDGGLQLPTENKSYGLCGMVDNGMYSGVYINDEAIVPGNPTYIGTIDSTKVNSIETFVLVVINDYAAAGLSGFERQICQLKYSTNSITQKSSVKKRTFIGNNDDYLNPYNWGNWEELGSGGGYINADDLLSNDLLQGGGLVAAYGGNQISSDITYTLTIGSTIPGIILDPQGKINSDLSNVCKGCSYHGTAFIRFTPRSKNTTQTGKAEKDTIELDVHAPTGTDTIKFKYIKYIINTNNGVSDWVITKSDFNSTDL